MADRKLAYGTATAITLTATSLADGAYRESTAIDNTSNLFLDALVGGRIQVGAVGADGVLEIYAYASWDGSLYTAGLTGSDAAITWGSGNTGVEGFNDLIPLGVAYVDTTDDNDDVEFGPFPVAAAFGGRLPPEWGIVVKNATGTTLHATGTNNEIKYRGIYETIA